MNDFRMLINGEMLASDETFPVINPAHGKIFAEAPECSEQVLEVAIQSAHAAFPAWHKNASKRREALMAVGSAIQNNAAEIAKILTQEQGKPLDKAHAEVLGSAVQIQIAAKLEIPTETVRDDPKGLIEIRRKPFGVVAAITPWNYPVAIAMGKVATALVAGNTVVLKPSPFTPLATLLVAEVIKSHLPPGVLNVVSGSDPLGAKLCEHPLVRKIDFTGSVATGRKVAAASAPDLKRFTLELGGNDPAIVLPDADPQTIAKGLFWGAFTNSGQVCIAIKRVYVHESIHDEVVKQLADLAKQTKVGDGMKEGTALGPINNKAQLNRIKELVADAKQHGGKIVTGGHAFDDESFCFENTLITDVDDTFRIVAEEQFGPVLPIMSYHDLDDAIARANCTHFGLGASVWSANVDTATEVAGEIECGTAWVNQHLALSPAAPFGGSKWSGIGYIHGHWGIEGATELQVLNVKRA